MCTNTHMYILGCMFSKGSWSHRTCDFHQLRRRVQEGGIRFMSKTLTEIYSDSQLFLAPVTLIQYL